jgi:methyl coenzyme M reductase beta subunit
LETEKNLTDLIELAKRNSMVQSVSEIQKCQTMINAFLNMILEDQLRVEEKSDQIHHNEKILDIGFFSTGFLSEANIVFSISKDGIDTSDIISQINSRIISMRFEYLNFKSSNLNLF